MRNEQKWPDMLWIVRHEESALPDVIEDEVCELTRAVMVSVDRSEGFSVEAAVLLALAVRAGGLDRLCEMIGSS